MALAVDIMGGYGFYNEVHCESLPRKTKYISHAFGSRRCLNACMVVWRWSTLVTVMSGCLQQVKDFF